MPLSPEPARCRICGTESVLVARQLRVCGACLRSNPDRALPMTRAAHRRARRLFNLPAEPPRSAGGILCTLCARACRMAEGERGYCNLRENRKGRMVTLAGGPGAGVLRWYYDPLPTNCVAMEVCGERGSQGRDNLAVFYGSCSLGCLFCQNWSHMQDAAALGPRVSASELADAAGGRVACICYFGGDPAPQLPHALAASRLARSRRPVRICWETNGTMHPRLLRQVIEVSLQSGGTIKFDLKAASEPLHVALTGFSNRRTLENFAAASLRARERPDPPLVVASTPLVPGYVDEEEVAAIAGLIASQDPEIPYRLLAFCPNFLMENLPTTSRAHAARCLAAARGAGVRNVGLGNVGLLSNLY